ncbi:MAG: hypothetical protein BAJALOKI1v1_2190005 [Promethearchaeota archaeon]|nr:MAG: hypothetical protein BAJALOKI1v1_2190005 [Candidatus Lokiarchaeota archaeon]
MNKGELDFFKYLRKFIAEIYKTSIFNTQYIKEVKESGHQNNRQNDR